MKMMSLPTPKPPVFSGNILAYPKWTLAFDALIDGEAVNPAHKLYYLGEYTSGQAQKMIDGLLGLQSDDAYKRARQILQERFGDPYKIYQAYNERLKSWPVCSKASELQEFSDFLLVKGKYDFNDLVDFVQKAAKDATHPVFSHEVLLSKRKELLKDKKQEDKNSYHKRKFGSFNTSKYNESSGHSDKNINELMCPACRKPHKLENCDIFLKKSVKERSELAKSKGLCFLCLCHGHMARSCKESIRCQTCKKPHATLLHFESKESKNGNKKENEESGKEKPKVANRVVVCHSNDCNEVTTSSLILPVWICHKDNPEKKIMTYAVLDDQSDTCFVTDSVCVQLEIEGPETVIELGTMHAVEDIRTQKISGLIVSSEDKSVDVPLPKAYSRENIPARRDQIPRVEMAINWSHLSPIANEIPEYRDDLGIGLLIGNNCVEAIKPRDVIPGKPQDPYAIRNLKTRTVFGWGLIGVTNPVDHRECQSDGTRIHCHRVTTKDITTQSTGSTFVEQTQVKEVLNPHEVLKMFEQDVSEKKRKKPMSLEDRMFLDITKREIHVTDDGHYELPLPFRNDKVELPSNRKLAESRLLRQRVRKKREEKDVENIEKAATVMKPDQAVTVEEMNAAEREIIKALQKEEFKQEISSLKSKPKVNVPETQRRRNTVARTSPIAKLDPFMDEHGVIRVGGRIRRSNEDGLVRKVKLMVGERRLTKQGRREKPLVSLERPVHKLILLIQGERPGIPAEEPDDK
ncbi:Hypothetical predicted protein [Paramuricea clavata]|uniref:Uncharacterized protein n=1 Tax=Paramuricea clavata TaxID=317549 RepID=A0A7D9J993_PARCT|nr:Hypothetical predicted protein [Paramuricea clavata]